MKEALFLQCRLDSSRLPGKALIEIEGRTVVEHTMAALKEVKLPLHVLVTTEDSYDTLAPLAQRWGFQCFAGPKEDVLLRFIQAADKYRVDRILRATADNPLVSAKLASELLKVHIQEKADYSGFLGIPLGTGVECLEVAALKASARESSDPYDHEHVAPYLYKNPQKFRIVRPDLSSRYGDPGIKISLDTPEDLAAMKEVYASLYKGQPIELEEIMSLFEKGTHG